MVALEVLETSRVAPADFGRWCKWWPYFALAITVNPPRLPNFAIVPNECGRPLPTFYAILHKLDSTRRMLSHRTFTYGSNGSPRCAPLRTRYVYQSAHCFFIILILRTSTANRLELLSSPYTRGYAPTLHHAVISCHFQFPICANRRTGSRDGLEQWLCPHYSTYLL